MKFELAGMGDDEQAKKDLAARYAEAKRRSEELGPIPDKLMDDVVHCMFGAKPKSGPAQEMYFLLGPWDGQLQLMNQTPEYFTIRAREQMFRLNCACSEFYDVAVYKLQCTPEGREFYRFNGFSVMMEGL